MISKLTGIVDDIEEENLTLDVNGVGYLVYIPNSSFSVDDIGSSQCLFIQTLVREDAINLYGFKSLMQKKIFNLLISVQGVGAKIALLMISQLSAQDLQQAILFEDINTLKSINGIGAKVAQRLITELKDKITKISNISSEITNASSKPFKEINSNIQEAISALEGLGYSRFEITKVISKIQQNANKEMSSEEIIKEYLLYMAQGLGK